MADAKTGPKSEDTKRDDKVSDNANQAGADMALSDARSNQFGDITSSSAGANNPGQHGRDGGTINGTENNPAPSDTAVSGEVVDEEQVEKVQEEKPAIKKL